MSIAVQPIHDFAAILIECQATVHFLALANFTLVLTCMQDTEFPGIVVKPVGDFKTQLDYQYQTLRANVDVLKLIQLGMSRSI